MHFEEPGWALVDDFFRAEAEGRSPATVRRYARVRDRLTHFLDVGDMALGLGTDPAALLEAERQFHPQGAFWTLFGPAELVCCLPSLLHETWLPGSAAEARVQVSLVARLLTHLDRQGLVDRAALGGAFWEAEAAVVEARREVARRAEAPGTTPPRMPDRFRQGPGPVW